MILTRDEVEKLINSCSAAASGYGGKPFAPHPCVDECESLDALTDKLIDWKIDIFEKAHSSGLTVELDSVVIRTEPKSDQGENT
tara:strand:+ start:932 stop:1183 length:252 start_codon:yes stop_codon:yes gene_type:complete